MQTFIRHEILLSIKQDYNPDTPNSPNSGVVAVVDNIQTDVSLMFPYTISFCMNKNNKVFLSFHSFILRRPSFSRVMMCFEK